ncbi:putative quinol monooxygenase [Hyunsoonleella ulvae]|uniref:putative quinol monooxygenase n=1 Tax=Hyunsoonleella ulvae TaxID=2799948 RepID=UPI00193A43E4|nr:putative quinol monooxygenase [Hyunsoonleella ulvae]
MKKVVVQANIQDSAIAEFLKVAEVMVAKSSLEPGCITYKISRGLQNENEFFFYEAYKSEDDLEKHNTSDHFNTFIASITPLLTEAPSIETFDV